MTTIYLPTKGTPLPPSTGKDPSGSGLDAYHFQQDPVSPVEQNQNKKDPRYPQLFFWPGSVGSSDSNGLATVVDFRVMLLNDDGSDAWPEWKRATDAPDYTDIPGHGTAKTKWERSEHFAWYDQQHNSGNPRALSIYDRNWKIGPEDEPKAGGWKYSYVLEIQWTGEGGPKNIVCDPEIENKAGE